MNFNAILIFCREKPFAVIPTQKHELLSIDQILDIYCRDFELTREHFSGQWIQAFDITDIEPGTYCRARPISPAANPWRE